MLAEDLRPPKRARNPVHNWEEQKEKREREREREREGERSRKKKKPKQESGLDQEGAVKEERNSHAGRPPKRWGD